LFRGVPQPRLFVMGYRILAETTVAIHCAFVAFVVVGGYLSLRWRRLLYLHVASAVWVALLTLGLKATCPLTYIENWARERAGEPGIPQGFVNAHLTGQLYPADLAWLFRVLVAAAFIASWVLLAMRRMQRNKGSNTTGPSTPAAQLSV
jgi:hypothetical protein